ncbi:GNAT family N-acetyltransferase [Jannaschia seohaensis]|uniref:Acetyltransferase (GNAT) domain-containing protein n=1 Tax=Jannaschia seohaensis TaxID=475081 RepID=A0A2Y9AB90_9RHOB|nr:GNAT family N-acetyltransferase [Jannaschia seohaensis]PWJ21140.1 acetyltransferase (GNAT) family protein [Jannaschia seohaensis]SSA41550.1 Acetyltransferase (GNAT) domain-containing protein [Jannaschia seohaensis]
MIRHRTMTEADLAQVLDWAAAEGWNPGLDDAAAFLAADPSGFFLADAESGPVAAISVVNHTEAFAFLGLYLVRPDWRGQGIGLALWHHAIAHAGDRTIGLDGVPAQQANYAASGFEPVSGTVRFAGRPAPGETPGIRPAQAADLPLLIEMEGRASGVEKPRYMGPWLSGSATRETLVSERAGKVEGFATVRRCRDGVKIGPLVAEDLETAAGLIAACAARHPGEVVIDVPGASTALASHCAASGMTPGFDTARMYRGRPPVPSGAIYAVGTLELG